MGSGDDRCSWEPKYQTIPPIPASRRTKLITLQTIVPPVGRLPTNSSCGQFCVYVTSWPGRLVLAAHAVHQEPAKEVANEAVRLRIVGGLRSGFGGGLRVDPGSARAAPVGECRAPSAPTHSMRQGAWVPEADVSRRAAPSSPGRGGNPGDRTRHQYARPVVPTRRESAPAFKRPGPRGAMLSGVSARPPRVHDTLYRTDRS